MKVKTVSYKRIKSLGNYQSATLEMHIEVMEGENVDEATKELQDMVDGLLGVPKLSELNKPPTKVESKEVDF